MTTNTDSTQVLMNALGQFLDDVRQERNLDWQQLAQVIGVSKNGLSKIVSPQGNPRAATIKKIAKSLDIPEQEVAQAAFSNGDSSSQDDDVPSEIRERAEAYLDAYTTLAGLFSSSQTPIEFRPSTSDLTKMACDIAQATLKAS